VGSEIFQHCREGIEHHDRVVANNCRRPRRARHLRFEPVRRGRRCGQEDLGYLIPAILRLPGLLHWYAGVSPEGSLSQVSVWDSEEHAAQMDELKEMRVRARDDLRAVGVSFTAETATYANYPITWTI
jgi:hypothetical protein